MEKDITLLGATTSTKSRRDGLWESGTSLQNKVFTGWSQRKRRSGVPTNKLILSWMCEPVAWFSL